MYLLPYLFPLGRLPFAVKLVVVVGLKFNPTNHKLRRLWVSTNSLNGQLQGFPLSLLGFFGIVCYLSPSPHSGHFGNNLVKSVSEN